MDYFDLRTEKDLANYLRCSQEFITYAINTPYKVVDSKNNKDNIDQLNSYLDTTIERMYIRKKGNKNGYRTVYAIKTFQLSNTLKILNNYLSEIFTPVDSVHGFVKGKSIVTNANKHLSKKVVLSVDIENYFESISKKMIKNSLIQVGFNANVANWISCITTLEGYLIQGFNTSPTLANIATHLLDKKLIEYCGEDAIYTRYADDLYFSSNKVVPKLADINRIITKYGFKLNKEKTKEMRRGQNQYVTGLTIFDKSYPRISKRIKRNLRLETYYISKFGFVNHAIRRLNNLGYNIDDDNSEEFQDEIVQEVIEIKNRLYGWTYFIHSVEPQVARNLYKHLFNSKN